MENNTLGIDTWNPKKSGSLSKEARGFQQTDSTRAFEAKKFREDKAKTDKERSKSKAFKGDDVTGGITKKIGGKVYKNVTVDFKPKATKVVKKAMKKQPSFAQVQKSVNKTKGYKK